MSPVVFALAAHTLPGSRLRHSNVLNSLADGGKLPDMTPAPQRETTTAANAIDPELLNILRCPLTRSRLRQEGDWLVAEVGGLGYPVRDGLPVMLMEEARLPAGVTSLAELKTRLQAGGQLPA
jgi:uncharacterized protein YbaR (Trm112 family)